MKDFPLIFIVVFIGFASSCDKADIWADLNKDLSGTYEGTCISAEEWLDYAEGFKWRADTSLGVILEIENFKPADYASGIGLIETNGNCAWDYYEVPLENLMQDTIRGAVYGPVSRTVIQIEIHRATKTIVTKRTNTPSGTYRSETIGNFIKVN